MTLLRCLLPALLPTAAGCATETGGASPTRPFHHPSCWERDPVCSPGCPAGIPSSW